jgi:indole-3-glycerol phosphate synthase
MMNILEKIVAHKWDEINELKALYPLKLLERSIYFSSPTVSLSKYLKREDKSGIIAEFKRQSPSRGVINAYAGVEDTSIGYMRAGASALSVLTDTHFFGGSNSDLKTARKFNFCPILRKEFIIDEYQIYEARSIGADAVLLIAEILKPDEVKKLARLAKSLDLEVVCEVHSGNQLEKITDDVDLIGVNNRNLDTFEVDINTSFELLRHIPDGKMKISESGISRPETVFELKKAGFNGFLIGENFMQSPHPGKACARFIKEIRKIESFQNINQINNAG